MLKVGIIGATGYAGEELIKILLRHPHVSINYLAAKINQEKKISEIFGYLKGKLDLICENFDEKKAIKLCDLFFLAVPHTVSMKITPLFLKNKKYVIDLSADYRLKNKRTYEFWYKKKHTDSKNLKIAVYGLSEIYEDKIRKAKLIANPGCYPTPVILSIFPLLKLKICKIKSIFIDAKSGYSGAGRKDKKDPFYQKIKDNFKAYNINGHRHIPEISEQLFNLAKRKIDIVFVPHLLPTKRGILETIYVSLADKLKMKEKDLIRFYQEFYKNKSFIKIKEKDQSPTLKDVIFTNFCEIALKILNDKKKIILITCIDNLLKGAAGQAVQNMNILFGFKQADGLI